MLVAAIMSRKPVTVERDHTVLHVARLMKENGVGAVIVVDARGRAIGICTDRDVAVRGLAGGHDDPGALPVDRIMTSPVVTAVEDSLLFDLLRLMAKKSIRRVPVVGEDRKVVGLVSVDDIVLLLTTELANVAEVMGHSSRALGGGDATGDE